MKKLKLAISLILVITFILPMSMFYTYAEITGDYVTVRIESYDKNIYYKKVSFDTTKIITLATLLKKIDELDENLTIGGIDSGYITEINSIAGGKFGGWDGWLFMLNGEVPMLSIADIQLRKNDDIVLYYGDAFGEVGMQYPTIDDSKFQESGILKFTSTDTVLGENNISTTKILPVVGAIVTWGYGNNETTQYTTDANGEIKILSTQREKGSHSIQIERNEQNGLATVLRFAPDFTYKVTTLTQNTTNLPVSIVPEDTRAAKGKLIIAALVLLLFAGFVGIGVSIYKKRFR